MNGERHSSLSKILRIAGAAGAIALVAALTMPASPVLAEDGTVSFFTDSDTPVTANWPDASSNELGIRFNSDDAGTVTALRFYKGEKNTGTHTGSLWTADGVQLATATFGGESGSGWQTMTFGTPVPITAGITYVASYHTSVGFYSVNLNAFADGGLDNGPLHVPTGGATYRGGAGFPDQPSNHNYWVDIVFAPGKATPTPAPSPTSQSPTPSASATASASASVTASPAPGGGLPVTGSNAAILAGTGVALAAVGGMLLLAYRRRTARFVP